MAKTNRAIKNPSVKTHVGGKAQRFTALMELRRTVSTCMLFENTFYEGADSIADRLGVLAGKVKFEDLINVIQWAKLDLGLRHAPLWLAVWMAKYHRGTALIGDTITSVIRRADELAEFLSMYQRVNGKDAPLSKQVKRGLANAFGKFDEYQFAKYDRPGDIKLRDVMFLTHPTPVNKYQEFVFSAIANQTLPPADTWEVAISAATSPQERTDAWTRLISEGKLGALALIRNLRNLEKDGVDRKLVMGALDKAKVSGILPFQLVAAWKASPAYAAKIDQMAQRALETANRLNGTTILLVDVSGSMEGKLSERSEMNRMDAASALAAHLIGVCNDVRVFTFSHDVKEVHPVPGFGVIDAISASQFHGGTWLGKAVDELPINSCDRLIVITDEQAHDGDVHAIEGAKNYMVNVAPYQYGVSVSGRWIRISGFSSSIVDWIVNEEQDNLFS